MGKYYGYNEEKKKFFLIAGTRPGNQSNHEVLVKIAARLKKLKNDGYQLTPLQTKFIALVESGDKVPLKKEKMDIAHHIAINAIMHVIADRMNGVITTDADEFVDNVITTESETSKERIKAFFSKMQELSEVADKIAAIDEIEEIIDSSEMDDFLDDSDLVESNTHSETEEKIDEDGLCETALALDTEDEDQVQALLDEAEWVTERINRSSKNLLPGHASPNRSLGSKKDPHITKKDGKYVNVPTSVVLGKSFEKMNGGNPYNPKARTNTEGKTEYQSSSIAEKSDNSWVEVVESPKGSQNKSTEKNIHFRANK